MLISKKDYIKVDDCTTKLGKLNDFWQIEERKEKKKKYIILMMSSLEKKKKKKQSTLQDSNPGCPTGVT